VAGRGQTGQNKRTRYTGIEQDFHGDASSRGSIRSRATIFRA
jgi:hypothetical protein